MTVRRPTLDRQRHYSTVVPPLEGGGIHGQDGYYFNGAGELVESLLTAEQRKQLAGQPSNTPKAPQPPAPAPAQQRAPAPPPPPEKWIGKVDDGGTKSGETQPGENTVGLTQHGSGAVQTEGTGSSGTETVQGGDAGAGAGSGAQQLPPGTDKNGDGKPDVDLVGWLEGREQYAHMTVVAFVKKMYGVGFTKKADLITFLTEDEKGPKLPAKVAID